METKIGVGYVIKKDGSVPFDAGLSDFHKALIKAALVDDGHHIEPHRHCDGVFVKNHKSK